MNDLEENKLVKERGWDINSWEEFRIALSNMKPTSKLYKIIKTELKKRNNWKNANRGPWKR